MHHVAFAVENRARQLEVREALLAAGHEDAALWTLSDPDDEESAQMLCQEELIAVLVAAFQKIIVRLEALEAA